MVAIKPLATIADKYVRRASAAQGDYQTGVQNTQPAKWEQNTMAGADNYAQGVSQAVANGMFQAGVQGKGAKWQRKATSVGPSRYQTGVAQAAPDFTTGFQRFFDTLSSLTLGPKGPRGDPRNYQRSQQVGEALNQARRQGGR
jgi:hypothetical protein